jgi:hypothetical protein
VWEWSEELTTANLKIIAGFVDTTHSKSENNLWNSACAPQNAASGLLW